MDPIRGRKTANDVSPILATDFAEPLMPSTRRAMSWERLAFRMLKGSLRIVLAAVVTQARLGMGYSGLPVV
jgi:hypothetical protein